MSKFYDVLGVTVGSDPWQVKAAFHALAKCSHPDVNTGDTTAEKRFKDINEAYQVLSDPERRSAYDLGMKHKDAEVRRRVRSAMAVTSASFIITVGCGLYFSLSDAARQFVGRRQSTELPTKYGSQPKQEILRQGVESLAQASPEAFSDIRQSEQAGKNEEVHTHGAIASASVPQLAAERDKDGRPAATPDANERKSPVAVGTKDLQSPQPDPEAQREQALRFHAKGMEQIAQGNVSAARTFFALAAKAGSTRSMRALAGTYDPVQLSKLKVVGMQPDIDAAQKWYQMADDLDGPASMERGVREEGASSAIATDKPAPDLTQFRAAYLSGDGLAYVVIEDEKSEHLYRYGGISRSNAKDDTQAYTLYACNTPHVFAAQNAEDKAALLKATVVKLGDPRFLELDAKYLSGCNNRHIKSAVPMIATMR
jgi:curved DNA-binding protein CbpA